MDIDVIYRPSCLQYESFCPIVKQCFPAEPFNRELFHEMQANHFWIVISNAQTIGYAYAREVNGHMHLSQISIIPGERGKGYARLLMDRLIGLSGVLDKTGITLSVQTDNAAAIRMYKEYSFTEKGKKYQYIIPHSLLHTEKVIGNEITAMVQNEGEGKDGLPTRLEIGFFLDGVSCGHCRLDPDFPGCSSYGIDLPEINFPRSLNALEKYLSPDVDHLVLTFSDTALRDVCEAYELTCNYELIEMEKRIQPIN